MFKMYNSNSSYLKYFQKLISIPKKIVIGKYNYKVHLKIDNLL